MTMRGSSILYIFIIIVLCGICNALQSTVPITIALKQRNLQQLEDIFWRISDPTSPSYGQHLSLDELKEYGCEVNTVARLSSWLKGEGASNIRVTPTHDYINADVPIKFAHLLYAIKDSTIRASLSTSVSTELIDAIEFVIATKATSYADFTNDPSVTKETRETTSASPTFSNKLSAYNNVQHDEKGTPNAQRAAYGIPANLYGTNKNNSQMVWGTGTYGYLDSDLAKFYKDFDVQSSINNAIHSGYMGVPGGDNFGEATLDLQTITGIAPGLKTYVSNTDNSSSTEDGDGFGPAFLQFVIDLNNNPTPPFVLSLSLGSLSFDSCAILCNTAVTLSKGSVSLAQCDAYMQQQRQVCMYPDSGQVDRINVELMKLGARGVTVLAATGDGGSHFSFQRFPTNDTIGQLLNTASCQYNLPTFPAESPYVLGVGGTDWTKGGSAKPEPWVASGSGFSWRYPVLPHQQAVVQQYLQQQQSKLPPASSFNASNRAYPDVAALALDVAMIMDGTTYYAGGTSASTPATGGIISLLNDLRLNKGLPTLGFVAPRLYQIAAQYPGEVFYDMTTGTSACDSAGFCCSTGFPAAPGWDPTTGLGSPIWAGLYKYLGDDSSL